MADSLSTTWLVSLGEYLQEESEKQWFWFSVFIALLLVGALWLEASLNLPGVDHESMLVEGETFEIIEWNDDGTEAILLVNSLGDSPLLHYSESELTPINFDNSKLNSISATAVGWIIAGDGGYLATSNGKSVNVITLNWGEGSIEDIISVASNDGTSGFLISQSGSTTLLHSFTGGMVSEGTAAPVSSSVMSDVFLARDGHLAVVTGYDRALGNPTFGPGGEVILKADAVLGDAPVLNLLHHGAGGAIHTAEFVDSQSWGDDVEMMFAGGTSTMLLLSDSTIIDLPKVGGSTAATIDSNGHFWFARGGSTELLSISSQNDEVKHHKISEGMTVEATHASAPGDEVHFYGIGVNGLEGQMSFEPAAQNDVSQSLARIGDLFFVVIVLFTFIFAGHLLYTNRFELF